jgi:phosphatidylcholine synthase
MERRGAPFCVLEGRMPGEESAMRRWAGYGVHLFTASGSVCGLLALLAVLESRFEVAFAWLFVALVVDGVDGTIARAVSVKTVLPRFSGERLDLVIDFVTYVLVPVVALLKAGFLAGPLGLGIAAFILLSSLFHFADQESKAGDHCFVGFPAVWNLVAFCIFAWGLPAWSAMALCVVLCVLAFVPMHWVHPMRVRRHLVANALVSVAGLGAALWTLATGFPADGIAGSVLAASAGYFVILAFGWKRLGAGDPEGSPPAAD